MPDGAWPQSGLVRPHAKLDDLVSGNASDATGNSTECVPAQGAGVNVYLTTVTITNSSATAVYVELKSGTTVMHTIPAPANFSGATLNFPAPLRPAGANLAWNFDSSAAVTSIICSMIGFKVQA